MSTDITRRRSGYTITVWRDLATGNVTLQRPAAIDPRDAADALRQAADIIDRRADLEPQRTPAPRIPTTKDMRSR
jgi:hypothetical protein